MHISMYNFQQLHACDTKVTASAAPPSRLCKKLSLHSAADHMHCNY